MNNDKNNNDKSFTHFFIELNVNYSAKISLILLIVFVQLDAAGNFVDELTIPIRTKHFVGLLGSRIKSHIRRSFFDLRRRVDEFVQNGSGWILDRVTATRVEFARSGLLTNESNFLELQ